MNLQHQLTAVRSARGDRRGLAEAAHTLQLVGELREAMIRSAEEPDNETSSDRMAGLLVKIMKVE